MRTTFKRVPRTAWLTGPSCAGLLAVALALATVPASASPQKCGTRSVAGGTQITFCGKAHANVSLAGHNYQLSGGKCQRTSSSFTINIGTEDLFTGAKQPPSYFGVTVFSGHDGTYSGVVAFVFEHRSYALMTPTVTLHGGRTKGTFTGTVFGSGAQASGSFSCA